MVRGSKHLAAIGPTIGGMSRKTAAVLSCVVYYKHKRTRRIGPRPKSSYMLLPVFGPRHMPQNAASKSTIELGKAAPLLHYN